MADKDGSVIFNSTGYLVKLMKLLLKGRSQIGKSCG